MVVTLVHELAPELQSTAAEPNNYQWDNLLFEFEPLNQSQLQHIHFVHLDSNCIADPQICFVHLGSIVDLRTHHNLQP